MRKPKSLKEGWGQYREAVGHHEAGASQVGQTQAAFYAGAQMVFNRMIFGLSQREGSEEADVRILQGISDELDAFVNSQTESCQ